jgi:hypothetical protein
MKEFLRPSTSDIEWLRCFIKLPPPILPKGGENCMSGIEGYRRGVDVYDFTYE